MLRPLAPGPWPLRRRVGVKRITARSGPWPLHDVAATRAAEAAGPDGLMARAGLAVARLALALAPHARSIAVCCGAGNNGGDGLVAATHLQRNGRRVRVLLCGDVARLPRDAAAALRDARAAGVPIADRWDGAAPDTVIDALLGLGAARAPDGAIAAAIGLIAGWQAAAVLAVDLPSGLHPDTGQPLGDTVVRASATLALLTLKAGLFTGQGRDFAGSVWFDDLGVTAAGATAQLAGAGGAPVRSHAQHKGSFGDVAVVGGAAGMTGGAWLAARAAAAAGAGRVYVSLLDPAAAGHDPTRPELMGRARWGTSAPDVLAHSSVVCGCGGGTAVRAVLPPLLAHAGRLVLDADALNAIAADSALQRLLQRRAGRTVLTPHPLEAARLLGTTTAELQRDRVAAAQRLADTMGCTVLLKGSGRIVAAPGRLASINPTGNALLASAGTGDVLAGWIGGSWTDGRDGGDAARDAAWLHGHAADVAAAAGRRYPLRAGDLSDAIIDAADAA